MVLHQGDFDYKDDPDAFLRVNLELAPKISRSIVVITVLEIGGTTSAPLPIIQQSETKPRP